MPTFRAVTDNFILRETTFKAVYDHYEDIWVQESKKRDAKTRVELVFDTEVQKIQSNGMKRFTKYIHLWDTNFKWKPKGFQCHLQSRIIQLFAPTLLGDDWDIDGPGLIKEKKWGPIKQGLLGITARRMGKSVIVSQGCTLLIIVVEDLKVVIISTGKRASGALKNQCKSNLTELGVVEPLITLDNQETLAVKMPDFIHESKIYSLPAGEEVRFTIFIILFILYTMG